MTDDSDEVSEAERSEAVERLAPDSEVFDLIGGVIDPDDTTIHPEEMIAILDALVRAERRAARLERERDEAVGLQRATQRDYDEARDSERRAVNALETMRAARWSARHQDALSERDEARARIAELERELGAHQQMVSDTVHIDQPLMAEADAEIERQRTRADAAEAKLVQAYASVRGLVAVVEQTVFVTPRAMCAHLRAEIPEAFEGERAAGEADEASERSDWITVGSVPPGARVEVSVNEKPCVFVVESDGSVKVPPQTDLWSSMAFKVCWYEGDSKYTAESIHPPGRAR